MINTLHLENFKGFAKADMSLGRLTVLVGPNGSGKTSVLRALDRLSRVAAAAIAGQNSRAAFSPDEGWSPEDQVKRGALKFELGAILAADGKKTSLRVVGEPMPTKWDTTAYISSTDGNFPGEKEQPFGLDTLTPSVVQVAQSRFLRLDAAQAVSPSFSDELVPLVAANGRGLASSLTYVQGRDPEAFEEISAALREVVPHVLRIRFDRTQMRVGELLRTGEVLRFDTLGAKDVRADEAGEGTVLVLALLTALLRPPQPNLLLLDDLELALHPRAQQTLIGVLRKLLVRFPMLQIVATSHSPFVLDCLEYEEVRQTVMTADGTCLVGHLTAHPEFPKWKELMKPGEFWSTVGESWLAERAAGART